MGPTAGTEPQCLYKGALYLYLSREICLELNAEKTKCMVRSLEQNAGRSHNIKIDNNSFEIVEKFKYLGTTLTDQNSIQAEIKYILKSGNACHQSV